jgi:ABC-type Fe3+ transport system permease subunit
LLRLARRFGSSEIATKRSVLEYFKAHSKQQLKAPIFDKLWLEAYLFRLMTRSKFVAILTGVISLILGVGYLALVQLLDFRGEMLPAPIEVIPPFFF